MGTYIIHFDDKPWEDLDDEQYYRCFEIPWFSTTKTTISRLTPYTEDSAYAHGYTEAESKYREIRDELEKQAYQRGYEEAYDTAYADAEEIYESGKRAMYQKGLKDAWEAARKITGSVTDGSLNYNELNVLFGSKYPESIINKYSASEAIEKIRQYEQKQEESEEPKKEQSVTVEEVMRQYLETFCLHAGSCVECPLHTPDFTCGRGCHFFTNKPVSDEEVRRAYAEVLQRMKGEA